MDTFLNSASENRSDLAAALVAAGLPNAEATALAAETPAPTTAPAPVNDIPSPPAY